MECQWNLVKRHQHKLENDSTEHKIVRYQGAQSSIRVQFDTLSFERLLSYMRILLAQIQPKSGQFCELSIVG